MTAMTTKKNTSAWSRGVRKYAEELLEDARENGIEGRPTAEQLLNGAQNWREYSYGGCSLIYNQDICARLATPSEQRAKQNGKLAPNKNENWLDVQARALRQACALILSGAMDDDADLDAIKENDKFPQHRYRAVIGLANRKSKTAYFMALYRAKAWAEQAREIAGSRFVGYQIAERIGEHNYIYKEGR